MTFRPPSLAQLFEAPENYTGVFGWLCGYSADAGFVEDAVERFSKLTTARRAYQGRIYLALTLDPGSPQILPVEVPGVLHLPVKSPELPFKLLHAKVAVLGFRQHDQLLLRVIVTTGNWTRQTLEESLDLAWHIDILSEDEDKPIELQRQDRTDLAAVWSFLSWLHSYFDTRAIDAAAISGSTSDSAAAAEQLAAWATALGKRHRGYRPRFVDNREEALLQQLPELVLAHAGPTARNYIALGSGFYEGAAAGTPTVPEGIFARLRQSGLLTGSCSKTLFVNPLACQSIATCQTQVREQGWVIRCAIAPDYFGAALRSLHAKFVFSANERAGSNNCTSPWIYLGSGNLTHAGFRQKAGSTGNLETGVLLVLATLKWENDGSTDDDCIITNVLPIHYMDEEGALPVLQPGEDMPDRSVEFQAAPIALFLWRETPEGACLEPQGDAMGPYRVLNPDGQKCVCLANGGFAWTAARPHQVFVAWTAEGKGCVAAVPVIDRYGRFCSADVPSLDLDEAWIQLANFPMPPNDEELAGSDALEIIDGASASEAAMQAHATSYPIRRMMALVEDIAAKQTQIAEADWSAWCNRLEQVLISAKDSGVVAAFRTVRLDPLGPLFQPSFRPAFASTPESLGGKRYEAALLRVIEAWNLADCKALGALP